MGSLHFNPREEKEKNKDTKLQNLRRMEHSSLFFFFDSINITVSFSLSGRCDLPYQLRTIECGDSFSSHSPVGKNALYTFWPIPLLLQVLEQWFSIFSVPWPTFSAKLCNLEVLAVMWCHCFQNFRVTELLCLKKSHEKPAVQASSRHVLADKWVFISKNMTRCGLEQVEEHHTH